MSIFSSYKKIFLLGFIITILVAIPFTVYLAQKRQQTTTKAAAATILSFEPAKTTVKEGETLTLNIMLNPGTGTSANQVSFVKLSINFDPSKFTTLPDSLKANPESSNKLTYIIDDPKYDNTAGKASISLSVGADPTNAIKVKTKIVTLQLKATAATAPTEPNLTFDSANTQVLSIASTDQTSENVLSTTIPATVTVTSVTVSTTPTITPAPGKTTTESATESATLAPICSTLEVDGLTNGTALVFSSLTFTATGSAQIGTVSKISFDFGDSIIEDLTTGGGIGTGSVSGQLSHAYKTPGTYTAYAVLTDNSNNVSKQTDCTRIISISPDESAQITQAPLEPPGDGKTMLSLEILGIIITIIGGALLLL